MALTISQINITDPDITESSVTNFISPSTNWVSKRHEGLVLEGQTSLIAQYSITADANYHLSPIGEDGNGVRAYYFSRAANRAWEQYYSWTVDDTYYTTTGKTQYIQSSVLKIYYTPPVGVTGLDPDPTPPEGGFSSHLHDIRFEHDRQAIVSYTPSVSSLTTASPTYRPSQSASIISHSQKTGNYNLSVRKLNAAKTDYTHSYNFTNNTFVAKGDGLQTTLVTFPDAETGLMSTENVVKLPSTDESATYSLVASAGTIPLSSKIPDAINETNFQVVRQVNATFTPGAKTGVTVSGTVTTDSSSELSYPYTKGPTKAFTFVYTKSSGTLTLDRQPLNSDITGAYFELPLGSEVSSGGSTFPIQDTTGLLVGMQVKDYDFEEDGTSTSALPSGTIIGAVNTNTSITLKTAVGSAVAAQDTMGANRLLLIYSDWTFDMQEVVATINGAATAVTVTGKIKVLRYGTAEVSGNIVLQPNFLTIS